MDKRKLAIEILVDIGSSRKKLEELASGFDKVADRAKQIKFGRDGIENSRALAKSIDNLAEQVDELPEKLVAASAAAEAESAAFSNLAISTARASQSFEQADQAMQNYSQSAEQAKENSQGLSSALSSTARAAASVASAFIGLISLMGLAASALYQLDQAYQESEIYDAGRSSVINDKLVIQAGLALEKNKDKILKYLDNISKGFVQSRRSAEDFFGFLKLHHSPSVRMVKEIAETSYIPIKRRTIDATAETIAAINPLLGAGSDESIPKKIASFFSAFVNQVVQFVRNFFKRVTAFINPDFLTRQTQEAINNLKDDIYKFRLQKYALVAAETEELAKLADEFLESFGKKLENIKIGIGIHKKSMGKGFQSHEVAARTLKSFGGYDYYVEFSQKLLQDYDKFRRIFYHEFAHILEMEIPGLYEQNLKFIDQVLKEITKLDIAAASPHFKTLISYARDRVYPRSKATEVLSVGFEMMADKKLREEMQELVPKYYEYILKVQKQLVDNAFEPIKISPAEPSIYKQFIKQQADPGIIQKIRLFINNLISFVSELVQRVLDKIQNYTRGAEPAAAAIEQVSENLKAAETKVRLGGLEALGPVSKRITSSISGFIRQLARFVRELFNRISALISPEILAKLKPGIIPNVAAINQGSEKFKVAEAKLGLEDYTKQINKLVAEIYSLQFHILNQANWVAAQTHESIRILLQRRRGSQHLLDSFRLMAENTTVSLDGQEKEITRLLSQIEYIKTTAPPAFQSLIESFYSSINVINDDINNLLEEYEKLSQEISSSATKILKRSSADRVLFEIFGRKKAEVFERYRQAIIDDLNKALALLPDDFANKAEYARLANQLIEALSQVAFPVNTNLVIEQTKKAAETAVDAPKIIERIAKLVKDFAEKILDWLLHGLFNFFSLVVNKRFLVQIEKDYLSQISDVYQKTLAKINKLPDVEIDDEAIRILQDRIERITTDFSDQYMETKIGDLISILDDIVNKDEELRQIVDSYFPSIKSFIDDLRALSELYKQTDFAVEGAKAAFEQRKQLLLREQLEKAKADLKNVADLLQKSQIKGMQNIFNRFFSQSQKTIESIAAFDDDILKNINFSIPQNNTDLLKFSLEDKEVLAEMLRNIDRRIVEFVKKAQIRFASVDFSKYPLPAYSPAHKTIIAGKRQLDLLLPLIDGTASDLYEAFLNYVEKYADETYKRVVNYVNSYLPEKGALLQKAWKILSEIQIRFPEGSSLKTKNVRRLEEYLKAIIETLETYHQIYREMLPIFKGNRYITLLHQIGHGIEQELQLGKIIVNKGYHKRLSRIYLQAVNLLDKYGEPYSQELNFLSKRFSYMSDDFSFLDESGRSDKITELISTLIELGNTQKEMGELIDRFFPSIRSFTKDLYMLLDFYNQADLTLEGVREEFQALGTQLIETQINRALADLKAIKVYTKQIDLLDIIQDFIGQIKEFISGLFAQLVEKLSSLLGGRVKATTAKAIAAIEDAIPDEEILRGIRLDIPENAFGLIRYLQEEEKLLADAIRSMDQRVVEFLRKAQIGFASGTASFPGFSPNNKFVVVGKKHFDYLLPLLNNTASNLGDAFLIYIEAYGDELTRQLIQEIRELPGPENFGIKMLRMRAQIEKQLQNIGNQEEAFAKMLAISRITETLNMQKMLYDHLFASMKDNPYLLFIHEIGHAIDQELNLGGLILQNEYHKKLSETYLKTLNKVKRLQDPLLENKQVLDLLENRFTYMATETQYFTRELETRRMTELISVLHELGNTQGEVGAVIDKYFSSIRTFKDELYRLVEVYNQADVDANFDTIKADLLKNQVDKALEDYNNAAELVKATQKSLLELFQEFLAKIRDAITSFFQLVIDKVANLLKNKDAINSILPDKEILKGINLDVPHRGEKYLDLLLTELSEEEKEFLAGALRQADQSIANFLRKSKIRFASTKSPIFNYTSQIETIIAPKHIYDLVQPIIDGVTPSLDEAFLLYVEKYADKKIKQIVKVLSKLKVPGGFLEKADFLKASEPLNEGLKETIKILDFQKLMYDYLLLVIKDNPYAMIFHEIGHAIEGVLKLHQEITAKGYHKTVSSAYLQMLEKLKNLGELNNQIDGLSAIFKGDSAVYDTLKNRFRYIAEEYLKVERAQPKTRFRTTEMVSVLMELGQTKDNIGKIIDEFFPSIRYFNENLYQLLNFYAEHDLSLPEIKQEFIKLKEQFFRDYSKKVLEDVNRINKLVQERGAINAILPKLLPPGREAWLHEFMKALFEEKDLKKVVELVREGIESFIDKLAEWIGEFIAIVLKKIGIQSEDAVNAIGEDILKSLNFAKKRINLPDIRDLFSRVKNALLGENGLRKAFALLYEAIISTVDSLVSEARKLLTNLSEKVGQWAQRLAKGDVLEGLAKSDVLEGIKLTGVFLPPDMAEEISGKELETLKKFLGSMDKQLVDFLRKSQTGIVNSKEFAMKYMPAAKTVIISYRVLDLLLPKIENIRNTLDEVFIDYIQKYGTDLEKQLLEEVGRIGGADIKSKMLSFLEQTGGSSSRYFHELSWLIYLKEVQEAFYRAAGPLLERNPAAPLIHEIGHAIDDQLELYKIIAQKDYHKEISRIYKDILERGKVLRNMRLQRLGEVDSLLGAFSEEAEIYKLLSERFNYIGYERGTGSNKITELVSVVTEISSLKKDVEQFIDAYFPSIRFFKENLLKLLEIYNRSGEVSKALKEQLFEQYVVKAQKDLDRINKLIEDEEKIVSAIDFSNLSNTKVLEGIADDILEGINLKVADDLLDSAEEITGENLLRLRKSLEDIDKQFVDFLRKSKVILASFKEISPTWRYRLEPKAILTSYQLLDLVLPKIQNIRDTLDQVLIDYIQKYGTDLEKQLIGEVERISGADLITKMEAYLQMSNKLEGPKLEAFDKILNLLNIQRNFYDKSSELIKSNPNKALIHEIGHAIDQELGLYKIIQQNDYHKKISGIYRTILEQGKVLRDLQLKRLGSVDSLLDNFNKETKVYQILLGRINYIKAETDYSGDKFTELVSVVTELGSLQGDLKLFIDKYFPSIKFFKENLLKLVEIYNKGTEVPEKLKKDFLKQYFARAQKDLDGINKLVKDEQKIILGVDFSDLSKPFDAARKIVGYIAAQVRILLQAASDFIQEIFDKLGSGFSLVKKELDEIIDQVKSLFGLEDVVAFFDKEDFVGLQSKIASDLEGFVDAKDFIAPTREFLKTAFEFFSRQKDKAQKVVQEKILSEIFGKGNYEIEVEKLSKKIFGQDIQGFLKEAYPVEFKQKKIDFAKEFIEFAKEKGAPNYLIRDYLRIAKQIPQEALEDASKFHKNIQAVVIGLFMEQTYQGRKVADKLFVAKNRSYYEAIKGEYIEAKQKIGKMFGRLADDYTYAMNDALTLFTKISTLVVERGLSAINIRKDLFSEIEPLFRTLYKDKTLKVVLMHEMAHAMESNYEAVGKMSNQYLSSLQFAIDFMNSTNRIISDLEKASGAKYQELQFFLARVDYIRHRYPEHGTLIKKQPLHRSSEFISVMTEFMEGKKNFVEKYLPEFNQKFLAILESAKKSEEVIFSDTIPKIAENLPKEIQQQVRTLIESAQKKIFDIINGSQKEAKEAVKVLKENLEKISSIFGQFGKTINVSEILDPVAQFVEKSKSVLDSRKVQDIVKAFEAGEFGTKASPLLDIIKAAKNKIVDLYSLFAEKVPKFLREFVFRFFQPVIDFFDKKIKGWIKNFASDFLNLPKSWKNIISAVPEIKEKVVGNLKNRVVKLLGIDLIIKTDDILGKFFRKRVHGYVDSFIEGIMVETGKVESIAEGVGAEEINRLVQVVLESEDQIKKAASGALTSIKALYSSIKVEALGEEVQTLAGKLAEIQENGLQKLKAHVAALNNLSGEQAQTEEAVRQMEELIKEIRFIQDFLNSPLYLLGKVTSGIKEEIKGKGIELPDIKVGEEADILQKLLGEETIKLIVESAKKHIADYIVERLFGWIKSIISGISKRIKGEQAVEAISIEAGDKIGEELFAGLNKIIDKIENFVGSILGRILSLIFAFNPLSKRNIEKKIKAAGGVKVAEGILDFLGVLVKGQITAENFGRALGRVIGMMGESGNLLEKFVNKVLESTKGVKGLIKALKLISNLQFREAFAVLDLETFFAGLSEFLEDSPAVRSVLQALFGENIIETLKQIFKILVKLEQSRFVSLARAFVPLGFAIGDIFVKTKDLVPLLQKLGAEIGAAGLITAGAIALGFHPLVVVLIAIASVAALAGRSILKFIDNTSNLLATKKLIEDFARSSEVFKNSIKKHFNADIDELFVREPYDLDLKKIDYKYRNASVFDQVITKRFEKFIVRQKKALAKEGRALLNEASILEWATKLGISKEDLEIQAGVLSRLAKFGDEGAQKMIDAFKEGVRRGAEQINFNSFTEMVRVRLAQALNIDEFVRDTQIKIANVLADINSDTESGLATLLVQIIKNSKSTLQFLIAELEQAFSGFPDEVEKLFEVISKNVDGFITGYERNILTILKNIGGAFAEFFGNLFEMTGKAFDAIGTALSTPARTAKMAAETTQELSNMKLAIKDLEDILRESAAGTFDLREEIGKIFSDTQDLFLLIKNIEFRPVNLREIPFVDAVKEMARALDDPTFFRKAERVAQRLIVTGKNFQKIINSLSETVQQNPLVQQFAQLADEMQKFQFNLDNIIRKNEEGMARIDLSFLDNYYKRMKEIMKIDEVLETGGREEHAIRIARGNEVGIRLPDIPNVQFVPTSEDSPARIREFLQEMAKYKTGIDEYSRQVQESFRIIEAAINANNIVNRLAELRKGIEGELEKLPASRLFKSAMGQLERNLVGETNLAKIVDYYQGFISSYREIAEKLFVGGSLDRNKYDEAINKIGELEEAVRRLNAVLQEFGSAEELSRIVYRLGQSLGEGKEAVEAILDENLFTVKKGISDAARKLEAAKKTFVDTVGEVAARSISWPVKAVIALVGEIDSAVYKVAQRTIDSINKSLFEKAKEALKDAAKKYPNFARELQEVFELPGWEEKLGFLKALDVLKEAKGFDDAIGQIRKFGQEIVGAEKEILKLAREVNLINFLAFYGAIDDLQDGIRYLIVGFETLYDAAKKFSNAANALKVAEILKIDISSISTLETLLKSANIKNFKEATEFFNTTFAEFVKLEDKINYITTLFSGQGERVRVVRDEIKDAVIDITRSLGGVVNTEQVADALYNAFSAFPRYVSDVEFGVRRASAVTEAALKMTAAAGGDAATNMRALAQAMVAYGASAEEAAEFGGKILEIQNQGITTVPEYAQYIGSLAAQARYANISLEELGGTLAGLTQMMRTEQAAEGLRSILAHLSSGMAAEAKKLLEEKGIEFGLGRVRREGLVNALKGLFDELGGDVEGFAKVLGDRLAVRTALAIVEPKSIALIQDSMKALGNAGMDSLNKAVEIRQQGFAARLQALVNRAQAINQEFGEKFANAFQDALAPIEAFVAAVEGAPGVVKDLLAFLIQGQVAIGNFTAAVFSLIGGLAKMVGIFVAIQAFVGIFNGFSTIKFVKELFTLNTSFEKIMASLSQVLQFQIVVTEGMKINTAATLANAAAFVQGKIAITGYTLILYGVIKPAQMVVAVFRGMNLVLGVTNKQFAWGVAKISGLVGLLLVFAGALEEAFGWDARWITGIGLVVALFNNQLFGAFKALGEQIENTYRLFNYFWQLATKEQVVNRFKAVGEALDAFYSAKAMGEGSRKALRKGREAILSQERVARQANAAAATAEAAAKQTSAAATATETAAKQANVAATAAETTASAANAAATNAETTASVANTAATNAETAAKQANAAASTQEAAGHAVAAAAATKATAAKVAGAAASKGLLAVLGKGLITLGVFAIKITAVILAVTALIAVFVAVINHGKKFRKNIGEINKAFDEYIKKQNSLQPDSLEKNNAAVKRLTKGWVALLEKIYLFIRQIPVIGGLVGILEGVFVLTEKVAKGLGWVVKVVLEAVGQALKATLGSVALLLDIFRGFRQEESFIYRTILEDTLESLDTVSKEAARKVAEAREYIADLLTKSKEELTEQDKLLLRNYADFVRSTQVQLNDAIGKARSGNVGEDEAVVEKTREMQQAVSSLGAELDNLARMTDGATAAFDEFERTIGDIFHKIELDLIENINKLRESLLAGQLTQQEFEWQQLSNRIEAEKEKLEEIKKEAERTKQEIEAQKQMLSSPLMGGAEQQSEVRKKIEDLQEKLKQKEMEIARSEQELQEMELQSRQMMVERIRKDAEDAIRLRQRQLEIQDKLVAGEISQEEAKQRLARLNLELLAEELSLYESVKEENEDKVQVVVEAENRIFEVRQQMLEQAKELADVNKEILEQQRKESLVAEEVITRGLASGGLTEQVAEMARLQMQYRHAAEQTQDLKQQIAELETKTARTLVEEVVLEELRTKLLEKQAEENQLDLQIRDKRLALEKESLERQVDLQKLLLDIQQEQLGAIEKEQELIKARNAYREAGLELQLKELEASRAEGTSVDEEVTRRRLRLEEQLRQARQEAAEQEMRAAHEIGLKRLEYRRLEQELAKKTAEFELKVAEDKLARAKQDEDADPEALRQLQEEYNLAKARADLQNQILVNIEEEIRFQREINTLEYDRLKAEQAVEGLLANQQARLEEIEASYREIESRIERQIELEQQRSKVADLRAQILQARARANPGDIGLSGAAEQARIYAAEQQNRVRLLEIEREVARLRGEQAREQEKLNQALAKGEQDLAQAARERLEAIGQAIQGKQEELELTRQLGAVERAAAERELATKQAEERHRRQVEAEQAVAENMALQKSILEKQDEILRMREESMRRLVDLKKQELDAYVEINGFDEKALEMANQIREMELAILRSNIARAEMQAKISILAAEESVLRAQIAKLEAEAALAKAQSEGADQKTVAALTQRVALSEQMVRVTQQMAAETRRVAQETIAAAQKQYELTEKAFARQKRRDEVEAKILNKLKQQKEILESQNQLLQAQKEIIEGTKNLYDLRIQNLEKEIELFGWSIERAQELEKLERLRHEATKAAIDQELKLKLNAIERERKELEAAIEETKVKASDPDLSPAKKQFYQEQIRNMEKQIGLLNEQEAIEKEISKEKKKQADIEAKERKLDRENKNIERELNKKTREIERKKETGDIQKEILNMQLHYLELKEKELELLEELKGEGQNRLDIERKRKELLEEIKKLEWEMFQLDVHKQILEAEAEIKKIQAKRGTANVTRINPKTGEKEVISLLSQEEDERLRKEEGHYRKKIEILREFLDTKKELLEQEQYVEEMAKVAEKRRKEEEGRTSVLETKGRIVGMEQDIIGLLISKLEKEKELAKTAEEQQDIEQRIAELKAKQIGLQEKQLKIEFELFKIRQLKAIEEARKNEQYELVNALREELALAEELLNVRIQTNREIYEMEQRLEKSSRKHGKCWFRVSPVDPLPFSTGGIVPGSGNRDTVPAVLTPGEVILNRGQQRQLAENIMRLSSQRVGMSGGSNNQQGGKLGLEPEIGKILAKIDEVSQFMKQTAQAAVTKGNTYVVSTPSPVVDMIDLTHKMTKAQLGALQ